MNIEPFYVVSADGRKRIKVKFNCSGCGCPCGSHKYNLTDKKIYRCRKCNNQIQGLKRRGKPSTKRGKTFKNLQREKSVNWKGGRYVGTDGYVMVLVKSGSTNRKSGWDNYKKEHVVLIEKQLGRKIRKNECIHHIDGNKQNNNLDNLVVIKSNKHHRQIHFSLQKIGYELLKKGLIKFNRKTLDYELNSDWNLLNHESIDH